ncbi:MAG: reprolysin-like metallopeptidase [Thermoproteota archaeon]
MRSIIAATLLAALLMPYAPAHGQVVVARIDVGVVVFDLSGKLSASSLERVLSRAAPRIKTLTCGRGLAYVELSFNVVDAPVWAELALAAWMRLSYREDLGVPEWVESYGLNTSLHPVRWLDLGRTLVVAEALSQLVVRLAGIDSDVLVAVIGDLDGVSRQYYLNHSGGLLVGVSGWAMAGPPSWFSFYDLTVAPRPRPEPSQPFYGMGKPVSPSSVKPFWELEEPSKRAAELVAEHAIYHLVGSCTGFWSPRQLHVEVIFVDLGGRSTELAKSFNPSLLQRLLRAAAPWINYTVSVALADEKIIDAVRMAVGDAQIVNGWLALNATRLDKALSSKLGCGWNEEENATYPVLVLATESPSFMQMRMEGVVVNFTGYSTNCYAAIAFPGYWGRAARLGLERVVAHELGHALGAGHPFQAAGAGISWEMDWAQTVMSYEDLAPLPIHLPGGDGYLQWILSLVHSAHLAAIGSSEAASLLSVGKPFEAVHAAMGLDYPESARVAAAVKVAAALVEAFRVAAEVGALLLATG